MKTLKSVGRSISLTIKEDLFITKFYKMEWVALGRWIPRTIVDMSNKGLDNQDAYMISKILRTNRYVEKLILSHNNIGYEGIFSILESIIMNPQSRLQQLHINDQNHEMMCDEGINIKSDLFTISYSPDNNVIIELKNNVINLKNKKLRVVHLQKNQMMSDVHNKILSEYLKRFKGLSLVRLEKSALTDDFIDDIISITMTTHKTEFVYLQMSNIPSNLDFEKVHDIWLKKLYNYLVSNPHHIGFRRLYYTTSTDTHVIDYRNNTLAYVIFEGHDKLAHTNIYVKTKEEFMNMMLHKRARYMKYYLTGINKSMNRNDKFKLQ